LSRAAASDPGLIFASMLAANIGSGATVGVAGLAYRDGISAWWWSGSAGLASFVLAFGVGPRIWTLAKQHGFFTTGDFLEFRYGAGVRAVITVLILLGSLAILAGQIIAGAAILNVLTGAPRWVGSIVGGAIMTIYFAAGGLLGTALVNTVQLVVMLVGFLLALPFVIGGAGGLDSCSCRCPALQRRDVLRRPGVRMDAALSHRARVHRFAGTHPEVLRRPRRTRTAGGHHAQCDRAHHVRVRAGAHGHCRARDAARHHRPQSRAPDAPAGKTAGWLGRWRWPPSSRPKSTRATPSCS
jgi:hypothetical protein